MADWQTPITETIEEVTAGAGILSQAFELLPGESASVVIDRTDNLPTATESWLLEILPTNDGVTPVDVAAPPRTIGPLFRSVHHRETSEGLRYFFVRVTNAELVPTEKVKVEINFMSDGVAL